MLNLCKCLKNMWLLGNLQIAVLEVFQAPSENDVFYIGKTHPSTKPCRADRLSDYRGVLGTWARSMSLTVCPWGLVDMVLLSSDRVEDLRDPCLLGVLTFNPAVSKVLQNGVDGHLSRRFRVPMQIGSFLHPLSPPPSVGSSLSPSVVRGESGCRREWEFDRRGACRKRPALPSPSRTRG